MKFLKRLLEWEDTAEFIGVIAGRGIFVYVCSTWVLTFWNNGNHAVAIALMAVIIGVSALAVVKIPIVLIIVLGASAVSAAAFFSGRLDLSLPTG